MSNGFVYCYVENWSVDVASTLLDDLAKAGLQFVNPETKSVVALSSEFETAGDPIETDLRTLTTWLSLADRIDQAFQLWLDGTRNVLSRVARTPDYVLQDFSLNGLGRDAARSVADTIVSIALNREEGLAGLVVDFSGESGNTDWDRKMAGRHGAVTVVPELVIARERALPELAHQLGDFVRPRRIRQDLFAFDRSGLPAVQLAEYPRQSGV